MIWLFIASLAFNTALYLVLLKKFSNADWKMKPGFADRWSAQSKPTLGGIGFYASFVAMCIWLSLNDMVGPKFFVAITLAFALGLADDLRGISPLIKFAGQFACAAILLTMPYGFTFFEIPWLNHAITLLWLVGMMNSFNMLDNMDGIATTVAIFIILGFCIFMSMSAPQPLAAGLAIMLAALCAFFFFNRHPSLIFMGDSGSMVMGLLLGFLFLVVNHQEKSVTGNDTQLAARLLITFAIPLADSLLVTVNRLRHGISPARGGRDHSTHNLFYIGLSENKIILLFASLSALQLAALFFITDARILFITAVIYFAALLSFYFTIASHNLKLGKFSYKK